MRRLSVLMFAGALFWSSPVGGETVKTEDVVSDPQHGRAVFEANCVTCHGKSGKGNGPTGAYMSPPPADLTSEDVRTDPDAELLSIISNGILDKGMPAWKSSLSTQEIHDVLAYIRTLSDSGK
ncbi:c-type cytochrome [Nitrospira sp. M1]